MMICMEATFVDGFTAIRWARDEDSAFGYLESTYSDRHGRMVGFREVVDFGDEE